MSRERMMNQPAGAQLAESSRRTRGAMDTDGLGSAPHVKNRGARSQW